MSSGVEHRAWLTLSLSHRSRGVGAASWKRSAECRRNLGSEERCRWCKDELLLADSKKCLGKTYQRILAEVCDMKKDWIKNLPCTLLPAPTIAKEFQRSLRREASTPLMT